MHNLSKKRETSPNVSLCEDDDDVYNNFEAETDHRHHHRHRQHHMPHSSPNHPLHYDLSPFHSPPPSSHPHPHPLNPTSIDLCDDDLPCDITFSSSLSSSTLTSLLPPSFETQPNSIFLSSRHPSLSSPSAHHTTSSLSSSSSSFSPTFGFSAPSIPSSLASTSSSSSSSSLPFSLTCSL